MSKADEVSSIIYYSRSHVVKTLVYFRCLSIVRGSSMALRGSPLREEQRVNECTTGMGMEVKVTGCISIRLM